MGRESPGLRNFQQSQEQQRQFSLFFIDYLLYFIDYLLLFIVYSLLIIVYSLLISVYSLLIIFYSLLIIVYSLLIFFYPLLILVHYLSIIFLFYNYYCICIKIYGNHGLVVEDRISKPEELNSIPPCAISLFSSKNRRKFSVITENFGT